MKTLDENGNERKAQDIQFSVFIYLLKNNDFDQLIDDIIKKKKIEVLNLKSKKINLTNQFNLIIEEVLISEKIEILGEMKIVYTYKNFEIALKTFLSAIYPNFDKRQAYKKNYVLDFLKEQGIELGNILYDQEIDQLRRVNNAIKHSNILETDNIHSISEFRSKDILEYNDILKFYNRVNVVIPYFFIDLRAQILTKLKTKNSSLTY